MLRSAGVADRVPKRSPVLSFPCLSANRRPAYHGGMFEMTAEDRAAVERICRECGVRRLDLFGSATSDAFDPERSDLDFLVEFGSLPPGRRFDAYFDLFMALEQLFERPVDLVTTGNLENPFFLRAVQQTRWPVFATRVAAVAEDMPCRPTR